MLSGLSIAVLQVISARTLLPALAVGVLADSWGGEAVEALGLFYHQGLSSSQSSLYLFLLAINSGL